MERISTISEISMVGQTEARLTESQIPFEVGISKYEELAKAQIVGDHSGMLKILFHPDTRKVLGVHVIGESAAEIVHIGQAVLTFGGTMDHFRDTVFNYPTFAEAYKVAGLDGLNKLQDWWWVRVLPPPGTLIRRFPGLIRPRCRAGATQRFAESYYGVRSHFPRIFDIQQSENKFVRRDSISGRHSGQRGASGRSLVDRQVRRAQYLTFKKR
jgi:Pyridine nucleotide-disulphide oxidoreductase, dimerisation domain